MDEMDDKHFAAQIQELQEKLARSGHLGVEVYGNEIKIEFFTPGEENPFKHMRFDAAQHHQVFEQTLVTIGEILAHDHAKLHHFRLATLDFQNNGYPQFWRGLAANRVLKKVQLFNVTFPNEPDGTRFLGNPALESLDMFSCNFSHGTFDSLCQGIQSSHIKKLIFIVQSLSPEASWSSLWSALEHGANRLESLVISFSQDTPGDIENGFESFLTNNSAIHYLHLNGFKRGRDDLPFLQALGRGLAVNTAVKMLNLGFSSAVGNPAIGKPLIQTVFSEGLDHNMMVNSLTVEVNACLETVNALADGLERMMRNRASAATRGGHDQEESLPVLKELVLDCQDYFSQDSTTTDTFRDQFFDRLSQSDVIRVEKVKVTYPQLEQLLSSGAYDFVRSTWVTKSLELCNYSHVPNDNELANLADAMEANNSISELKAGRVQFHKMTDLLSSPNKYRIRCQCRRNEIQVRMVGKDQNLSLLPLSLARLLLSGDTPGDDMERREIEARLLVDRTIAFEILKDIPALFAVCGKRKRED